MKCYKEYISEKNRIISELRFCNKRNIKEAMNFFEAKEESQLKIIFGKYVLISEFNEIVGRLNKLEAQKIDLLENCEDFIYEALYYEMSRTNYKETYSISSALENLGMNKQQILTSQIASRSLQRAKINIFY